MMENHLGTAGGPMLNILTSNEIIRYAALVHDLGKGTTPKELYPHHYGHDERGVEPLKSFSKRIGVPKEWYKNAKMVVLEHMKGRKILYNDCTKKSRFYN